MRFFDPEMPAVVSARATLETGLREAVHKGHLLLQYQAQVESEAQLLKLAEQGCNHYQGFLFSRPLALGEFEAYVRNRDVTPET